MYSSATNFWHLVYWQKLKSEFIISNWVYKQHITQFMCYFYKSFSHKIIETKKLQSIIQKTIMSWEYGWNAQSALLPEKTKQIKVGDKGNQKIKAAMLLSKEKLKNLSQTKSLYPTPKPEPKRNKGVEQRINRDKQAQQHYNLQSSKSLSMVKNQLLKKQKIYQSMQKNSKNHSLFMVDFVEKDLSKQDEQLQQLKNAFYAGKLQQIMNQQQIIHEGQQKDVHQHVRQNLAWEKEVLQQLKGEVFHEKLKVAQSFDRKLTEDQKMALNKVIQQRIKDKQRINQLNRQRQLQNQERIRKLRKLDILQDSDEEQQKNY